MDMNLYPNVNFSIITKCITRYVSMYYQYPDYANDSSLNCALRDSLSSGQLYSKIRVVDMLLSQSTTWRSGAFIGHWHGILPLFLHSHNIIDSGRGLELSQFWSEFSIRMNHDWDWHSDTGDVRHRTWRLDSYDLVVNTSCEHMDDSWLDQIASGTTVCAQSTDCDHPTHINCVQNMEQFLDKFNGFSILATDDQLHEIYSRFTVLAVKQ